jgi:glycosyltransferase involved in cell wall biosynthesis
MLDGHERAAITVGRIAREKNVEFLIKALEPMRGIRLIVVGDGPLLKRLRRRYKSAAVCFTGMRQGVDLARLYASADVFVSASTSETYGQVYNEAMASGLPVVAVSNDVTREVLTEDPPGVLTRHEVKDFQSGLARVISSHEQMRTFALGLARSRKWSDAAHRLFQLYPARAATNSA